MPAPPDIVEPVRTPVTVDDGRVSGTTHDPSTHAGSPSVGGPELTLRSMGGSEGAVVGASRDDVAPPAVAAAGAGPPPASGTASPPQPTARARAPTMPTTTRKTEKVEEERRARVTSST